MKPNPPTQPYPPNLELTDRPCPTCKTAMTIAHFKEGPVSDPEGATYHLFTCWETQNHPSRRPHRILNNLPPLKTLCTRCQAPLELFWDAEVEWCGKMIPREKALELSLRNEFVYIGCDKCISEMPDVKLGDLRVDPNSPGLR